MHLNGGVIEGDHVFLPALTWPFTEVQDMGLDGMEEPLFSRLLDTMGQTVSHLFHSKSRCLGETADQARRASAEALVRARKTIRDFWDHLAPDLRALPASERASVVSGPWASLRSGLWTQLRAVQESGASRVRLWFTKGQSKDEGQRLFRTTFQSAVGGLEGEMSAAYSRGIQ